MQQKLDTHIFQGMQQDVDPHRQKAEFLVDALNIRISNRGEDTSYAITSEKSTEEIELIIEKRSSEEEYLEEDNLIHGVYLGHCVLNNYVIIFTHEDIKNEEEVIDKIDRIYRIKKVIEDGITNYYIRCLCKKDLGFNTEYLIECFASYENEKVQKVYWTDSKNPLRVINIVDERNYNQIEDWTFDFTPSLKLEETVSITKDITSGGAFPAGVLQYVFTYYIKYGQETNIVYQSPLLYTSQIDRAESPEKTVSNSFKIKINNLDNRFDYIRIYSIMRTSLNAVPTCKRVIDLEIKDLNTISYIDNGLNGDIIDPTELLYKGGESVTADTLTTKNGTMFLGNLKILRPYIKDFTKIIKNNKSFKFPLPYTLSDSYRKIYCKAEQSIREYLFTLNTLNETKDSLVTPSTFKSGEKYRLGVQFQYKTGKWSDPIWVEDKDSILKPDFVTEYRDNNWVRYLKLPIFQGDFDLSAIKNLGYKKVRSVVVLPTLQNRKIITQGLLCPTVFNNKDRNNNAPYAQASWFLRNTYIFTEGRDWLGMSKFPIHDRAFEHNKALYGFADDYSEIQGVPPELSNIPNNQFPVNIRYTLNDKGSEVENLGKTHEVYHSKTDNSTYFVDQRILTLNSADLQFDEDIYLLDSSDLKLRIIGVAAYIDNSASLSISTSSPPIYGRASGVLKVNEKHRDRTLTASYSYEDSLVYDKGKDNYVPASEELYTSIKSEKRLNPKFLIYPWHKSGSLNNDGKRSVNGGQKTAVLKEKKLSNLLYYVYTKYFNTESVKSFQNSVVRFFNSDQVTAIKLNNEVYYGNIDTLAMPVVSWGSVFYNYKRDSPTDVLFNTAEHFTFTPYGLHSIAYKEGLSNQIDNKLSSRYAPWSDSGSETIGNNSGKETSALRGTKEGIRIKYKSTPHAVIDTGVFNGVIEEYKNNEEYKEKIKDAQTDYLHLFIGEIYRDLPEDYPYFGGTSSDALKANLWIPAGEAVNIEDNKTTITWEWGDTYFQRFDFLKTYAFTNDDPNSVIEIGSFMGEFRVNADGRYDKNRGQIDNTLMSPQNFNLYNPVYSQTNNFFNYRILDEDYYKIDKYPNTITWTLEHRSLEDVDNWTNITMANTLDLDGNLGEITSLENFNDTIYAFQNKGISKILFNDRVQVNASDGVPIEISNSYKVSGNVYLSNSSGCANKHSVLKTPLGLYFIDSNNGELYSIGEKGINNISSNNGMSNWFKNQIDYKWNPKVNLKSYYDFNNNDLYIVNNKTCLNYSEKLGHFISFFNYEKAIALFNVSNNFYGFTQNANTINLYKMFASNSPCNLFGNQYDYNISFISNLESARTKVFTNLELNADWRDLSDLSDGKGVNYNFDKNDYTFFDILKVSNEYQIGEATLSNLKYKPSNAKNKARIWRTDIPRQGRQRISNPWCKITLSKNLSLNKKEPIKINYPIILHNANVIYYI